MRGALAAVDERRGHGQLGETQPAQDRAALQLLFEKTKAPKRRAIIGRLLQLKPDGIMVIPVGPPGAQHILKVVRKTAPDGTTSVVRSDLFGGKIIPFVPLSGGHQSEG